ncbi:hypothetical protein ACP70R_028139 [Stipagrostis hirtigluma subsp. patula]
MEGAGVEPSATFAAAAASALPARFTTRGWPRSLRQAVVATWVQPSQRPCPRQPSGPRGHGRCRLGSPLPHITVRATVLGDLRGAKYAVDGHVSASL